MEHAQWYDAEDGRELWLVTDTGKLLRTQPRGDTPWTVTDVPGTVTNLRFQTETTDPEATTKENEA